MFDLPEHFNDELSMYFAKSLQYWKNTKNVKVYEIEYLLHTFIVENVNIVNDFFNHFNIDIDEIVNNIESGDLVSNSTSTDESKIFGSSFIDTAKAAFIGVHASNPLETVISVDNMFLTMCTDSNNKLYYYLRDLGLSNKVIEDYIFNNSEDISDALDNILNKDDDIFGSSGDSGMDTLDPNPNAKKHKTKKFSKNNDRSIISLFATNMLDEVKEGKIGNIIGRNKEIDMLQEILCRKTKRNALLLGDPGVGKTAIVEGLALAMVNGDVPLPLRNKRLYNFNVNSIVSGTRFRGDFEERLKGLMDEINEAGDIILFIDEFHMVIGTGGNSNNDMSNILKPALANGTLQLIGATTDDEFEKYIAKDKALERRFQNIHVNEPNDKDTKEILLGLKNSFEEYHMVNYSEDALDAAIRYGKQYLPTRFAPDKTIDLIDIAGAKTKMRTKIFPDDIKTLQKELEKIREKKDEVASKGNLIASKKYKEKEDKLLNTIKEKEDKYLKEIEDSKVTITENEIAEVVSRLTDIPTSKISQSDADRLLNLEDIIHQKIVGQDKAVETICKCIRRNMSGLRDPKKPIGVFLLIGPTGTGKSELSKNIATEIFGKESNLVKLNMSEYSERIDTSKILGAQPGYVGYDDHNALTDKIRKTPYSVLLLDEIEKAHKDIYNLFLQVFEDGELVDGQGRKAYFNNCIIIMTSNIGAEKAYSSNVMGFDKTDNKEDKEKIDFERINSIMKKECEHHFSPEFLNRIDDIIIFERLNHDQLLKIIDLMMDKLNKRIKHRGIKILLNNNTKKHIIDKGYDPKYGARPINRAIKEIVEDYMANKLLTKEINDNTTIELDYNKEKEKISHVVVK